MLEIDVLLDEIIAIPNKLEVIQEVTCDPRYNNFNLGKHKAIERRMI